MQAGTTGFSETLQPAAADDGDRGLDRPERRRRPAGRARLHLPERRLRDQPRAAADRLRRGQPRELRSGHQADVQRRDERQRPARAASGRLGHGGWYHRDYQNLRRRDNTLQTFADYTPFTLYSPIDGTPITYYNVSAAARSRVNYVDTTAGERSEDVVQRLRVQLQRPAAARHHAVRRRHERADRSRRSATRQSNPNLLLYCDQTKSGIPFRTQFKIAGSVPVDVRHPGRLLVPEPAGLRLRHRRAVGPRRRSSGPSGQPSATQLNNAERRGHGVADHADHHATRRRATRASRRASARSGQLVDPGMNVASLSVPLIAPKTEYGDRINQLDLNVSKTFKVGHASIQPKIRLLQRAERVAGLRRARA